MQLASILSQLHASNQIMPSSRPPRSTTAAQENAVVAHMPSDVETKYASLRALRETEPEAEARKLAEALEETKSASAALIASLRAELAAARGGAAPAPQPSVPADETATEAVALAEALQQENAALKAQLAALDAEPKERLLKFYETMTGLTATPGEGSVVHCSCHAEGERRLAFDLDMQPEESEPGSLEYTPTDGGTDEATARHLPEYMRDSIVFEAEQAPVFLQKVLVAVTAA